MEAKLKEIAENFSPFSWTQTATPKLLSFRGKYFTMELKIFSNKIDEFSNFYVYCEFVCFARNPALKISFFIILPLKKYV